MFAEILDTDTLVSDIKLTSSGLYFRLGCKKIWKHFEIRRVYKFFIYVPRNKISQINFNQRHVLCYATQTKAAKQWNSVYLRVSPARPIFYVYYGPSSRCEAEHFSVSRWLWTDLNVNLEYSRATLSVDDVHQLFSLPQLVKFFIWPEEWLEIARIRSYATHAQIDTLIYV